MRLIPRWNFCPVSCPRYLLSVLHARCRRCQSVRLGFGVVLLEEEDEVSPILGVMGRAEGC